MNYLRDKYPHLVEITSLGKSFEGRDLMIATVSTGVNKKGDQKPAIWIDAGTVKKAFTIREEEKKRKIV